jgi:hypothetical protein
MDRDQISVTEYLLTGAVVASCLYATLLYDCAKTMIGNRSVRLRSDKNPT